MREALANKATNGRFRYLPSRQFAKKNWRGKFSKKRGLGWAGLCAACVEPCQTYAVQRDRKSKTIHVCRLSGSACTFIFTLSIAEFGLIHVRLQTWLPFTIQVCLNGRSIWRVHGSREA